MTNDTLNATAHKILDAAENFTQTIGFNAFSYRDLQETVGVKTSTIHYYFASKQDLATAMIDRYGQRLHESLEAISAQPISATEKLGALWGAFTNMAQEGKLCLCCIMSSELKSFSPEAVDKLLYYTNGMQEWVAHVIEQGITEEVFSANIVPNDAAAHFMASLDGASLTARMRQNTGHMDAIFKQVIKALS